MKKYEKEVQQAFLKNEEEVIAQLKKTYSQALNDINGKIEKLMMRSDADMQHVIYQVEYQKALKKEIEGILDVMNTEQFSTVSDYLVKCYEEGFVGTMYSLQKQGIPLAFPLDQKAVVNAVQIDSKISNGLYNHFGENIAELKKHIASEVSRGVSTGKSFAEVAEQISKKMVGTYENVGGSLAYAMRIARTEGHRIQIQSAMDASYKAKEMGADVVKQWDATLDSRTRHSHRVVDGEVRELDEKFSNGLRFPSDPHGGASEVVNCRCALLQRARWALDDSFTKMDNKTGNLVDFSNAKDYNNFKDKYWKFAEELEKIESIQSANYNSDLAIKFGKEFYDELHKRVTEAKDKNAAAVWKKYESEIKVGNAQYNGREHAMGNTIYVNGVRDAKGNSFQTPYQVTFHESGHAIDSLAKKTVENASFHASHYSSAYRDGLFPQTIKDEVEDLVKAKDKELKALFKNHANDVEWFKEQGYIPEWRYEVYKMGNYTAEQVIPKYSKSYAYSAIAKEVKASGSKIAYGDLSDILEGATNAKINIGIGHGATYWKQRTSGGIASGLATEAFAEMIDSTFANKESLDLIKKYLPKSYSVFQEMIENLLK